MSEYSIEPEDPPRGRSELTETATKRRSAAWLGERSPEWQRLEARLPELADRHATAANIAFDAVRSYPELARDVAIARRANPTSALAKQLERIYGRLHRSLFRPATNLRHDFAHLCGTEIPAVAYELRFRIVTVAIGFFLTGLGGWWLLGTFPDLASLFLSERAIEGVQRGELWTDGLLNVVPSSVLAVTLFTNNIAVAISAFALGSIYGLGTLYIISLNGIMLGGAFAFTARYGLDGQLFEFVVAHGFVELTVIAIAAAVGFSIGEAIARPAHRTRRAAFQRAVSRGLKLLLLCAVFLVGAGLIEGYVSPNPGFSLSARLAIGIGSWLLLLWALCGFRLPMGRRMEKRQTH